MFYSLSIKYLPKGTKKEEVYSKVDDVLEFIQKCGLDYRIGPSETTVLGTFDEVHKLLKDVNDIALSHKDDSFMILANITGTTYSQDFEDKLHKYE